MIRSLLNWLSHVHDWVVDQEGRITYSRDDPYYCGTWQRLRCNDCARIKYRRFYK